MSEQWMQEAFKKHTEGSLHRQLGVPKNENLPISFLAKIVLTEINKTIKNPTKIGKKEVKVTRLLKRRAVAALNAICVTQKRYKKSKWRNK